MNKKTIKKILQNEPITQEELNKFIVACVESHGKTVTPEQLQGIILAIQHRIFDLRYAAEQAGIKLGLGITKVFNKNGELLTVNIKG